MVEAVLAVVAGLVVFVAADAPVSRERLGRFAGRHGIVITEANAAPLVRYLALTRRWRAGGVAAGLVGYAANDLRHQSLTVNVALGLAGWFAGAVVAEARAAALTARGPASLVRRTPGRYVTPAARLALAAATGLCLWAALDHGSWALAALPLPLLVMLITRTVAVRAQSPEEHDVYSADEAIRASAVQSLHAAAVVLLLYAAAAGVHPAPALLLLATVALPLLGWWLARTGPVEPAAVTA